MPRAFAATDLLDQPLVKVSPLHTTNCVPFTQGTRFGKDMNCVTNARMGGHCWRRAWHRAGTGTLHEVTKGPGHCCHPAVPGKPIRWLQAQHGLPGSSDLQSTCLRRCCARRLHLLPCVRPAVVPMSDPLSGTALALPPGGCRARWTIPSTLGGWTSRRRALRRRPTRQRQAFLMWSCRQVGRLRKRGPSPGNALLARLPTWPAAWLA